MTQWHIQSLLRVLPEVVADALTALPQEIRNSVEEIRMRNGQPVKLCFSHKEIILTIQMQPIMVTGQMLNRILEFSTEHSAYASQVYLQQGFVTLEGGHRIGFCGQAVLDGGQITGLRELSSVCIRVARAITGYEAQLRQLTGWQNGSVLIIGPPGAGKTTLLREVTRVLSDVHHQAVSLVDERFEIAGCRSGRPVFSVGGKTDILSGCPKALAIPRMLRTMNPQWLIFDEITEEKDIKAAIQASYCGVLLAATAHAANLTQLRKRPLYQSLLRAGIFQNLITIDEQRRLRMEVLV